MKNENSELVAKILRIALCISALAILNNCATKQVMVSVKDQRMIVMDGEKVEKMYPVSTSKFGLGDRPGSKCTPLGTLKVAKKIGRGMPAGAVFKGRRPTGEVLKPNAQGRDPIVTRILWLSGLEPHNRNAFGRFIYIHGTPEEWRIGSPASYGCIRMRSDDVIDLYDRIGVGTRITVVPDSLFTGDHLARRQQKSIARKERALVATRKVRQLDSDAVTR
ncbi:MAG: L,D-transpeptidase [Verrucomicrobia bacterium]|nr:L,D-transpeptidase [Verrucomicrobiota bacterium]